VPALPPLALLGSWRGRAAAADLKLSALLQVLCGVGLAAGIALYGRRPLAGDAAATYAALRPWLLAIAAALVAVGATALALAQRRFGAAARTVAAGGFAVALTLIAGAASAIATRYSAKALLLAAGPLAAAAPLYTVDTFDWTLPFYARRFVIPVRWRGELAYGLGREPAKGLATLPEFEARWRASAAAYALVPYAAHATLVGDGLEMRVLARDFDNVLVSRR
jgi:hypothetical protein